MVKSEESRIRHKEPSRVALYAMSGNWHESFGSTVGAFCMKNKIYISILILSITLPQLASAVWWNPTTWFKSEVKFEAPVKEQADFYSEQQFTNEPEVVEREVIKEIPVEKTITKTIDNPELLKQVTSLKAEVSKYKTSLEESNTYATQKIGELNSKISELNKVISDNEAKHKLAISSLTEKFNTEKEQIKLDAIKLGETNQKQKETNFFNSLFNSDYGPDAGSRLCLTWNYQVRLDALDQACNSWNARNFPDGQR